jgi:4-methyl-5(b-hydroxyethyl)-thiazole monophosphate biosynthesis
MASALVVLAPGAEEIETVTMADVLVRAGVEVVIAGFGKTLVVKGSRGISLGAHVLFDQVKDRTFDLVYLPGGAGSAAFCRDDRRVQDLAEDQLRAGRYLAVICAAPIALVPRGLCQGKRLTSFPGMRAQVEPHAAAWLDQAVVIDGKLVTSQGPGTALALALTLAGILAGSTVAAKVAKDMLAPST